MIHNGCARLELELACARRTCRGFYDHVVPPAACVPDDTPPQIDAGGVTAAYDQYGLRVPLLVVSPYARRGYVSHQVTDHTSILRFVEAGK